MITNEMVAYEFSESADDKRWDRWTIIVELRMGHNLDGDERTDGYSIDSAYDAYRAGVSPDEYIAGKRVKDASVYYA